MTKQQKIREGVAGKLFEWCKRNGFMVASFEWKELQGVNRGLILAITDIVLEYEDSQGVVIKVDRELPKLVSLTGEASVEEKTAFLLGAENYKEEMVDAGCVATESLIKEPKQ